MISDYMQKINQYLHPDIQNTSLGSEQSINFQFEIQLKKSAQYLETLRKNSYKIEQLIFQNDKLRQQITLQRKTIQMHLKKEIELKFVVSTLEEEVQILNEKLIFQETLKVRQTAPKQTPQISPKQVFKLQQKLSNCIAQNQILRSQNQSYRSKEFTKQQNYRIIQQQFKENLKSLTDQIHLLKADLQQQTEKTSQLEKVQAENHLLKIENKRIQSTMELNLKQNEAKMSLLIYELESQKCGKEVVKQKYEELTNVIQIIDEMRREFKAKKKSLNFVTQQNQLLNAVQFNQDYPLLVKNKKTLIKQASNKKSKENKS